MKTRIFITIVITLFSITANAKIWRVNNNTGINADFTTAQEAHDGAEAGDTLFFEGSSDSYGNLIMIKKLIIIGPGYELESNENTQVSKSEAIITKIEINDGSQGAIIMGMDFSAHGGYQHEVKIDSDSITIKRCILNLVKLTNTSNSTAINVLITQSFLKHGGVGYYFYASNTDVSNVIITNNIILGNISLKNSGHTISNNYISGEINVNASKITNNIVKGIIRENQNNNVQFNLSGIGENINTYFTANPDSPDGYYILSDTSLALGAGENGVDCGPFGGINPYVLSGIPRGPHIYEAVINSTAIKEDGLDISIKIKTQN